MDRNRTVAGLDVHKDSIYLCIMGHDGSIIFEKTYVTLTPELRQMCNDMTDRGVSEAAMESTAVYWMPAWNELCESMTLKLVNPYFIRRLPGFKSDVKDAQWIPPKQPVVEESTATKEEQAIELLKGMTPEQIMAVISAINK